MRAKDEKAVVTASLLNVGNAWVSRDHPLLQEQSALDLFNDVGAELQEVLGEEGFAVELDERESGLLFTLKVGEAANAPP